MESSRPTSVDTSRHRGLDPSVRREPEGARVSVRERGATDLRDGQSKPHPYRHPRHLGTLGPRPPRPESTTPGVPNHPQPTSNRRLVLQVYHVLGLGRRVRSHRLTRAWAMVEGQSGRPETRYTVRDPRPESTRTVVQGG